MDEDGWLEMEPSDRGSTAGDPLIEAEAKAALEEALGALSAPQRRVLLLRYYGEMSFEEIAATLACPLNTALSHCHRGLLALRRIMTENQA
jgi:RNA polymerase sigma-70 factor (ECF subfamily)